MGLNLVKLCVGVSAIEELQAWVDYRLAQREKSGKPKEQIHTTRMLPKRRDELLDGGSLYWVFKGVVLARQRIIRLDEVDRGDGIRRCGIVLDPDVVRTEAAPKRPFQGWRYLDGKVAPRDLARGKANDDLPPKLMAALAEIGVR